MCYRDYELTDTSVTVLVRNAWLASSASLSAAIPRSPISLPLLSRAPHREAWYSVHDSPANLCLSPLQAQWRPRHQQSPQEGYGTGPAGRRDPFFVHRGKFHCTSFLSDRFFPCAPPFVCAQACTRRSRAHGCPKHASSRPLSHFLFPYTLRSFEAVMHHDYGFWIYSHHPANDLLELTELHEHQGCPRPQQYRSQSTSSTSSSVHQLLSNVPYTKHTPSLVFGLGSEHPFSNYWYFIESSPSPYVAQLRTNGDSTGHVAEALPKSSVSCHAGSRRTFLWPNTLRQSTPSTP